MTIAPTRPSATRLAALFLLVGLGLGASGCGRYGPLEPPPDASAAAPTPASSPSDNPASSVSHHSPPPIAAPKTPFALDPLL